MSLRRTIRDWYLRLGRALRDPTKPTAPERLDREATSLLVQSLILLTLGRRVDAIEGLAEAPFVELRETPSKPGHRLRAARETTLEAFDSALLADAPLPVDRVRRADLRALLRDLEETLEAYEGPDALGEMNQQLARIRVEIDGGDVRLADDEGRRRSGLFYTPAELAAYTTKRVLRGAIDDGRTPEQLRVLDPAMGTGAFLTQAFAWLLECSAEHGAHSATPSDCRRILGGQLHGVDLDRRAVELARWNLRYTAIDHLGDAIPLEVLAIPDRLFCGDALLFAAGDETEAATTHEGFDAALEAEYDIDTDERTPFHWEFHLDDILDEDAGDGEGFDAIVGNPPWVSFGLRDTEEIGGALEAYLRSRFHRSAEYKLPLYPLFMDLALRLTRRGGTIGLVVPDSFLTGSRFSNIRETLLQSSELEEITVLEEGTWAGGTSGRTVLYRTRRCDEPGDARLRLRRVPDVDTLTEATRTSTIEQSELASGPHHRFDVVTDAPARRLLDRMRRAEGRLGELLEFYSGGIARYGQDSVCSETPRDSWTIRDRNGRPVVRDADAAGHWRPLVPSGRFLRRFELYRPDAWIYFHPDPDVRRRYAKSGFDPNYYDQPKLFLRQTGDQLVAAHDANGLFCLNNMHVATADAASDLHLASGLLNSAALGAYHRIQSMEGDRTLAQIDIDALRELPVPRSHDGRLERVETLAARCTSLGRRLTEADRDFRSALDSHGARAATLEQLRAEGTLLEIEVSGGIPESGRLENLEVEGLERAVRLNGTVEAHDGVVATLVTDGRRARNGIWLAFRELLRREWRKRVWARGDLRETLARSIELRLPRDDEAIPADNDLPSVAAELARLRTELDTAVAEVYGVDPTGVEARP